MPPPPGFGSTGVKMMVAVIPTPPFPFASRLFRFRPRVQPGRPTGDVRVMRRACPARRVGLTALAWQRGVRGLMGGRVPMDRHIVEISKAHA